jgi:hypothetical protein
MSENFVSLTTRVAIVRSARWDRPRNGIAKHRRSQNWNDLTGDYHLPFGQNIPIPGHLRP